MSEYLPIAILMTSLGVAPIILMMPEHASRLRTTVNLVAATLKLVLVVWLTAVVVQGESPDMRFTVAPGLDLHLQADALS
ncbi:MAG: monovalent cation/H+ antiporter subunit D family protein, partial [Octadecabacter sp.]